MEKLVQRAIERIAAFGDGLYLIVSLPKEYDKEKLKKRIENIAKKYNLKKENIIIDQDIEGNVFDIPIALLIKREDTELLPVDVITGYED
jgi:hypothetical protein